MKRTAYSYPMLLASAGMTVWLSACSGMPGLSLPRHATIADGRVHLATALLPQHPQAVSDGSVAASASRQGEVAVPLDGIDALLTELAAGHAVVLGQGIHAPEVVTGYDLDADALLLATTTPPTARHVPLATLREDWSNSNRWAIVVLPPGDLPARADAHTYLPAAGRLERAGAAWEAVLAYDAGVSQWPNNADALAGLGKSLFDLGDRQGAAEAFADAVAVSHDPDERDRITHLAATIDGDMLLRAEPAATSEKALPANNQ